MIDSLKGIKRGSPIIYLLSYFDYKIKSMKPRFYLRVINLTCILFPSWVNKCIVFDGWKKPYVTDCLSIINDLSFKEIKI